MDAINTLEQHPWADRAGVLGHSMGGHGALTLALRHLGRFRSVSAFAPICAPTEVPWGQKAFTGYLGEDRNTWSRHDAVRMIEGGARVPALLVDQALDDQFLSTQLRPERLEQACAAAGQPLQLRRHAGYDHGYFFIATFVADHLAHHTSRPGRVSAAARRRQPVGAIAPDTGAAKALGRAAACRDGGSPSSPPMQSPRFRRRALATAMAAFAIALLSACGGGGNPEPAAPASASAESAPRLFVAGDSLADVGTVGLKATVQKAADRAAGYPIYPEILAAQQGFGPLCNYFSSSDGQSFSTHAGCTDFAVGGAEIQNPITRGGSELPFSLEHQLETAVAANGGAWRPGDLIVIDAGGNDAAALAAAYLDARNSGSAEEAIYLALLAQQLSPSDIADALAQPDGRTVAAGRYMQQLAQAWWAALKANTLDKGAVRVALVDVPDITFTPRFRAIVADLAATEGAAPANAFQAALRQWVAGFNAELARLAAGESRVVLVPYFDAFTAHNTRPADFGLTNASEASCPPGNFADCTDAALDASPPAPGLAPGWWKSWYYSDEFHPSPRGHELLADTVTRALAQAGWR